jgi:hypothetical protein
MDLVFKLYSAEQRSRGISFVSIVRKGWEIGRVPCETTNRSIR